jgi:aminopeptidase N
MGSMGWFPNNDTPADKATFDITMAVPVGLSVLASGELVSNTTSGTTTTWKWREAEPMATYLATASLGLFDITQSKGPDGQNIYVAVDPAYDAANQATIDTTLTRIPEILTFLESLYGPYPFSAAGAIVDVAPTVGYALETQTKPNFPLPPDSVTLSHETAHQWFGDSVSLNQWRDIWLNEGFATWSQWVFDERRNGGTTTKQQFDTTYAKAPDDSFWQIPPANPGSAANIFSTPVYQRGAMTLEALREIVGEKTFLNIMRAWVAKHRYANATTAQFMALAQSISRRDLSAFFQQWLYQPGKPTITPASFGAA